MIRYSFTLALWLLGCGTANAQANSTVTTETYRDWVYNCATIDAKTKCEVISRLSTNDGALFSQISVQLQSETKNPLVQIAVPNLIDLKRGLTLSIEAGPSYDFEYSFCNNQACFVAEPLTDELLAALKRGNNAAMELRSLMNGEINATSSLLGFSAAFDRPEGPQ